MELVKIYIEEQELRKKRTAKTPCKNTVEKPEVDLGEVLQYLKLDIDLMLRR